MNKKGFTLVELIATIVIVLALGLIATPKVMNIINDNRLKGYKEIERRLEEATAKYLAENYVDSNARYISIEKDKLIEGKYIDEIYDLKDKSICDAHVIVTDLYNSASFKAMLTCSNYVTISPTKINLKVYLNGGETSQVFESSYDIGSVITLENPTKSGYTFGGWRVVSGDSELNGNVLTINSIDTTIYAVWNDKVMLLVDLDEGTTTQRLEGKYESGKVITLQKPIREEYEFVGWEVVSGNGIISDDTLTIGNEDTKIKATWRKNVFNFSINLNEGSSSQQFASKYIKGSVIELVSPTREGYVFVGWNVEGNGALLSGNILTIGEGDVALTAEWVKKINNFSYTGAVQVYTVGLTGYYKVELWGAQGGYDPDYSNRAKGAYTAGTTLLTKGDIIYIRVGQAGSSSQYESFNGGGRGGGGTSYGYSGGGATDIRYRNDELYGRLMVAAGGGGTGVGVYNTAGNGSHAGGLTGYAGGYYSGHTYNNQNGKGGSQVSGGTAGTNIYGGTGTVNAGVFGIGGNNLSTCSGKGASGGGGGYYGGGGGGATASGGSGNGAGGGSSYISGHTGCVAITSASSTAARTGTNGASCSTGTSDNLCSIHYSGMKFTDTVMIDGAGYAWTNTKGSLKQMPNPSGGYYNSGVGHSGNGYAKITFVGKTLSE